MNTVTAGGILDAALESRLAERAQDSRIVQAIMAEPWAITPKAMQRILTIALREDLDPQSIDTRQPPRDPMSGMRYGYVRGNGIGVLKIAGPVFRYANLFTELSGATSLELASRDLRALLDDEAVEQLVIDFDSPGGQVNGTEELSEMIFAARSEKNIVAFASGDAASAAYWMASATDRVVSNRTSMVGSIGAVIGVYTNQDDGIVEFVSAQSPKKRLDPKTEAGKAEYQRLIDSLGQVFVDTVARNRGVDVETVLKDYGQGGVMVGDAAKSAGLVDDVMSFDSLISDLTGSGSNQTEGFMTTKQPKPGDDGKGMTAEQVEADHPDIAAHFREQGVKSVDRDALRQEGATRERERIKAVQDQSLPGHEDLIGTLMFDGKTTGEQAAVRVLQAEKEKKGKVLGEIEKGSAEPQPASEAAPARKASQPDDGPADTSETALKAHWDKSADLREEFDHDFDRYVAYEQAVAGGRVKVLGGKK